MDKNIYMTIFRYGVNVRDCTPTKGKTEGIYKSRGLHKALNKIGIPHLVKSSKSPRIKILVIKYYFSYLNIT